MQELRRGREKKYKALTNTKSFNEKVRKKQHCVKNKKYGGKKETIGDEEEEEER